MDDNYIIDNKAISLKDQIIKYSNVSSEAKNCIRVIFILMVIGLFQKPFKI